MVNLCFSYNIVKSCSHYASHIIQLFVKWQTIAMRSAIRLHLCVCFMDIANFEMRILHCVVVGQSLLKPGFNPPQWLVFSLYVVTFYYLSKGKWEVVGSKFDTYMFMFAKYISSMASNSLQLRTCTWLLSVLFPCPRNCVATFLCPF